MLSTLVLLLSAITISQGAATAAVANVVDLGYAKYQGTLNPTTQNTQFLGIRYAAPPTGVLRWREPSVPANTTAIQQANAEPNGCLSAGQGVAATTPFRNNTSGSLMKRATGTSEDCLFLNVYVPGELNSKTNLPVVFWIHGGGYVSGSAASADGNDLLRESGNGVVVVIIQYRLGLFGFLPGAQVKAQGVLNAGLLDQQFALQWVQQHITKFGGDPAKVTIWGESAGAGSVLQHIVANGGNTSPPLFRAAMSSSSFLPSQYNFDASVPETLFREVVSQTNCTSAVDALTCLRQVDSNALETVNTQINLSGFFGTFVFVPVVDGTFITERPTQLINAGKVNGKVLLAVTNTNEGTVFVNQNTASTVTIPNYLAQLFPNFTPDAIATATALYQNLGTSIVQADLIMGESIFICPTYYLLKTFNGRSFKGEFAIPPGLHGNDVGYYFPGGVAPPFNNTAFIEAFSESFLNFAMSLDPNIKSNPADITPTWKLFDGSVEMLFNKTTANTPDVRAIETSAALLQRCEFWNSVGNLTAQ